MNTLTNIQNSLGNMFHSISDGWQHFYQRCKGALTHFESSDEHSADKDQQRLSWGLLNTDIVDNEKNFIVTMEVPGLDKSDINVDVQNNMLTISGIKRFKQEHDKGQYHIMECAYGRFQRSLMLPTSVSKDKIDAHYKNGVLRLVIPKQKPMKKIQIQIN